MPNSGEYYYLAKDGTILQHNLGLHEATELKKAEGGLWFKQRPSGKHSGEAHGCKNCKAYEEERRARFRSKASKATDQKTTRT